MKPLALALAAAVLGTGCIAVDHDDLDEGTVNVYWDFVRTAPAQQSGFLVYDDTDVDDVTTNGPCDESGVDFVTVDSPVGQVVVDCVYGGVEGVAIDYLPEGTRSFRVRGWRTVDAADVPVYDEQFSLAVRGNAETSYTLDVHGVAAGLDLFAYLNYGASPGAPYLSCAEAQPAGTTLDLGYEVRDWFGDLVLADYDVPCVGMRPVQVFAGNLELDDYTVRMQGYRHDDGAVVFDSCARPLSHFGAQIGDYGFAPILLTLPVPTCQ